MDDEGEEAKPRRGGEPRGGGAGGATAGAGAVNDKRRIAGEDPISRLSLNAALNAHSKWMMIVIQICQKNQRIGCVRPHCKLQRGITQTLL